MLQNRPRLFLLGMEKKFFNIFSNYFKKIKKKFNFFLNFFFTVPANKIGLPYQHHWIRNFVLTEKYVRNIFVAKKMRILEQFFQKLFLNP